MAARRKPGTTADPGPAQEPAFPWRSALAVAVAVAVVAFLVRLLFWRATPDAAWAWSALFKGDAPLWLDYAFAVRTGQPFELGLPIHPPGMAWLLAPFWNGDPARIAGLRVLWSALGALAVGLVTLAAARSFGLRVGALTGAFCALSTGLVLLSSALDSETPYLLLVAAILLLLEDVRLRPRAPVLLAWGALHGLACLFRVEHALYLAFLLGAAVRAWRTSGTAVVRPLLTTLASFALVLLPWQVHVYRVLTRFDTVEPVRGPAEEAALASVEQALSDLRWEPGALARRQALPAFARRTASAFVAATVAWRGGETVRAGDFGILEEAFGAVPRPLPRFPFVSAYGPLNFALANHPGATGGFDRRPLEEAPPLAGGAARYPPMLVQGLPPPRLSFDYPPHVRLFVDGTAVGRRSIAEDPTRFAWLVAHKLLIVADGATLGLTGHGLPGGTTGRRRAVDMATPVAGPVRIVWGLALLVLATAGFWGVRTAPSAAGWMLLVLHRTIVAAAFFGYARQGALLVPVVALGVSLAVDRWAIGTRRARLVPAAVGAILLLGLTLEAWRTARPPLIRLDGMDVGSVDRIPADLHRDHAVSVVSR